MWILTSTVVIISLQLSAGYSLEEESVREPKLLFQSAQVTDLTERMERLETKVENTADLEEKIGRLEGGVAGGYETFEDAKANFTMVFSNITNIYSKVKVLRAANKLKCSVTKCDNIRAKLKKLQTEIEFLKNLNMTELQSAITQISTFTTTITQLQDNVTTLTNNVTAQQQEIATFTAKVTTLETTVANLETNATSQQTEITSLNTKVSSLETTVTAMTDNATKQQAEIETLKTEVVRLETSITTNTNSITKHNNCFLDINSADCPTAKRRSGRELEEDQEEEEEDEGLVIKDYDDFNLGPHPSQILKDIFRSSRFADMKSKFKKKKNHKKKKVNRQTSGVQPLATNVKILIECMTDPTSTQCGTIYSAASTMPKLLSATCPSSTCTTLTTDMTTVKSCLTSPTDSGCSYTAATNLPALVSSFSGDLTPIKSCMTDPTATACTGTYSAAATLPATLSTIASCMTDPSASACTTTYSGASTLPKVLTGKCDQSTCTTLTTDMTTVKSCLTSPTDSGCSYTAATNLPALVSSFSGDLTPIKACLTDPTATACTGTYSAAATLPKSFSNVASCMTDPTASACTTIYSASTTLPQVLSGKCPTSTCTTLQTSLTTVTNCLTDPTATGCTGTYSASTTLPGIVKNLDKCMTNVDDGTCTASYGSSLVKDGSKGIVAYVKQLTKPAMVTCGLGGTTLTYPNQQSGAGQTTDGCDVSKWYETLAWTCTQTEPDKTDKFHMELDPATSTTKVKIKQDGWYSVSFTAYLTTETRQSRVELFKLSSKDASCAASTSSCNALLQLRGQDKSASSSNTNVRTTAGEGLYYLCADDQLTAIASQAGGTPVAGYVQGDTDLSRTILVVSRVSY